MSLYPSEKFTLSLHHKGIIEAVLMRSLYTGFMGAHSLPDVSENIVVNSYRITFGKVMHWLHVLFSCGARLKLERYSMSIAARILC